MALAPEIQAPQGGFIVVVRQAASEMYLPQARALAVYNIPADEIHTAFAGVNVAFRQQSQEMQFQQARVLAVVRGKVYNPKLRAWTFTLDGHDFYVLRLGDSKTLVYDLSTGQWSTFTSGDTDVWRLNTGMNWYSAKTIPETHGSNVIAGDQTYGHLWVLNPEQGYDDYAPNPSEDIKARFPRVATAQMITRERNFVPIYQVYLTGDTGNPVETGDTVTLTYSDDIGHTYVSAGDREVTQGDYNGELAWRSLGLVQPAGRLFRITDDGALNRIDGLDVLHGGEDG